MSNDIIDTSLTLVNGHLVIALNSNLMDEELMFLQSMILKKVNELSIKRVLFDFDLVKVITSYTYEIYRQLSKGVSLMGCKVAWVGLAPEVIVAMMDLNLGDVPKGICIGQTIDQGVALLDEFK